MMVAWLRWIDGNGGNDKYRGMLPEISQVYNLVYASMEFESSFYGTVGIVVKIHLPPLLLLL